MLAWLLGSVTLLAPARAESPAVESPAVVGPAVEGAAVESPAVESPAVESPAAPASAEPPPAVVRALPGAMGIVVFPFRAINLPDSDVQASDALFRARMRDASPRPVATVAPSRAADGNAETDADLAAACRAIACEEWVTVDLIRLDREIFVTAQVHDGAGAVLHRVDVVAPDVSALNGIYDRLAQALVRRLPYDRTTVEHPYASVGAGPTLPLPADRGARTEGAAGRVSEVERLHGLRGGVWVPLGGYYGPAIGVAYSGRWERETSFMEVATGFAWPTDFYAPFYAVYAEFAYSRMLNLGRLPLYYGAGGGPRIGGYADVGLGLGAFGQLGVTTARSRSTRGFAQVRLGADLLTSSVGGGLYAGSYGGLEAGVGF